MKSLHPAFISGFCKEAMSRGLNEEQTTTLLLAVQRKEAFEDPVVHDGFVKAADGIISAIKDIGYNIVNRDYTHDADRALVPQHVPQSTYYTKSIMSGAKAPPASQTPVTKSYYQTEKAKGNADVARLQQQLTDNEELVSKLPWYSTKRWKPFLARETPLIGLEAQLSRAQNAGPADLKASMREDIDDASESLRNRLDSQGTLPAWMVGTKQDGTWLGRTFGPGARAAVREAQADYDAVAGGGVTTGQWLRIGAGKFLGRDSNGNYPIDKDSAQRRLAQLRTKMQEDADRLNALNLAKQNL